MVRIQKWSFSISSEIVNIGPAYKYSGTITTSCYPPPNTIKNSQGRKFYFKRNQKFYQISLFSLFLQPLQMMEGTPSLIDEKHESNLPCHPTHICLVSRVQFHIESEIKYFTLKGARNLKSGPFPAPAGLQAVFLLGRDPSGKI